MHERKERAREGERERNGARAEREEEGGRERERKSSTHSDPTVETQEIVDSSSNDLNVVVGIRSSDEGLLPTLPVVCNSEGDLLVEEIRTIVSTWRGVGR